MKHYDVVVSIAGSDSGGGAGIQADLKTLTALGCYGATVITAITAQNTLGVNSVQPLSLDIIEQQFDAVFDDLKPRFIKIGMLGTTQCINLINEKILRLPFKPTIILDPVMIAQDGSRLLNSDAVNALKKLCSTVTLITPNIPEAEVLCEHRIHNLEQMKQDALGLAKQFNCHVLLKGGHLSGGEACDVLVEDTLQDCTLYSRERIITKQTHGTGCSLSSAISAYIAKGYALNDSVQQAKTFIHQAIQHGKDYQLGQGCGPINHLYQIQEYS